MSVDPQTVMIDAQKAAAAVNILVHMNLPAVRDKLASLGSQKLTPDELFQIIMLGLQEVDGGLQIAGLFVPWAAMADEYVRLAEIVLPVAWPVISYAVTWVEAKITAKPLVYQRAIQTFKPSPVPFQAFGSTFTGAVFS